MALNDCPEKSGSKRRKFSQDQDEEPTAPTAPATNLFRQPVDQSADICQQQEQVQQMALSTRRSPADASANYQRDDTGDCSRFYDSATVLSSVEGACAPPPDLAAASRKDRRKEDGSDSSLPPSSPLPGVIESGKEKQVAPLLPLADTEWAMAPAVPRQRYLLTVEYIGTGFLGWQKQRTGRTVQGVLEEALEKFLDQTVAVCGSSRTDTGVHGLGNTAHVDVERISKRRPGEVLPPHEPVVVKRAINHFLGRNKSQDMAVVNVQCIPDTFHARFAARGRVYCYRMASSSEPLSIFDRDRVWHVPVPLDHEAMKQACLMLEGHHDFSSFRATGCQANSPMRTLDELSVMAVEPGSPFPPPLDRGSASAASLQRKLTTENQGQDSCDEMVEMAGIGTAPRISSEADVSRKDGIRIRRIEDADGEGSGCVHADRGHALVAECRGERDGLEAALVERRDELLDRGGEGRPCTTGAVCEALVGGERGGSSTQETASEGSGRGAEIKGLSNGSGGEKRPPSERWTGGPTHFVVIARARSFLYHQVRLMVGLLKAVGCGEKSLSDVQRILDARTPTAAPPMAPSCGLYLAKVVYPVDASGALVGNDDNHQVGLEVAEDDSCADEHVNDRKAC